MQSFYLEFVEFNCLQAGLTIQLVDNLMDWFARIRKMQKIRLQCPLKFFASSSKCGCLTAFIVLFFSMFRKVEKEFWIQSYLFPLFFFNMFSMFFSSTKTRRYFSNSIEQKHANASTIRLRPMYYSILLNFFSCSSKLFLTYAYFQTIMWKW